VEAGDVFASVATAAVGAARERCAELSATDSFGVASFNSSSDFRTTCKAPAA